MRYFDQHNLFGSGTQVNMDGLHLVSLPPINAFGPDQPKIRRGPQPDLPDPIKSCTTRNFLQYDGQHQSQSKVGNEVTRSTDCSACSSCQSSINCSDIYVLTPEGCNAISPCKTLVGRSNVDESAKENSGKKTRRKGKQNTRVSSDAGSTEPEVLSDYAHGISTSESCGCCNDKGDELVSCATSPTVSCQDDSTNQIDLEVDTCFSSSEAFNICTSNVDKVATVETCRALEVSFPDASSIQTDFERDNRFSSSEKLMIHTSNIDDVAIVETVIPSIAQNLPEDHQVINSEVTTKTKDGGFSISDIGVKDTNQFQISCYDMHPKDFSYRPDSPALDSVSVGSNSEDGRNDNLHIKPYYEENSRGVTSEAPSFSSRKGSLSHKNSINGVAETYPHTKGTKHSSQNFGSSDVQLHVPGKRGKQIKTTPRGSSAHKNGGFGNLHGWTGKENNHSVWQKVERNDADGCGCEMKKVPVCSKFDMNLIDSPSPKRNCIGSEVNTSSKTEGKKLPKDKFSKKKRKNSAGFKQQHSCHGRGYNSNKASSNAHAMASLQQSETLNISAQVAGQKGLKSIASENGRPRAGFQTSRVEYVNYEPVQSSQVFTDAVQPPESTCYTGSCVKHCHTEIQCSSVPKLCSALEQNVLELQSPVFLPHLIFNKVSQTQKEITLAEFWKQNHSSRSVMQKWIPIGVRDPDLTTSARFSGSSPNSSDRPAGEDLSLRNAHEKVGSDPQDFVSSLALGMCQSFKNQICFPQEDEHIQKSRNSMWIFEHNKKQVAAESFASESTDGIFSDFEVESKRILHAVKDAWRVWLESEAIQMASGCPIAEFERVLHFSSPVISQSPSLSCCQNCLEDQLASVPVCRHEITNIPLSRFWQWYEEHGNYGLEVRAEDYQNSKKLGFDRISFHGYFVPFLSAVQLFKNHTSQPINSRYEVAALEVFDSDESSKPSENSNAGHLPIFSMLVPQPRTTAAAQSVEMTWSNDAELLFEYFESEPPQQRRPLYEKIQELVRGTGSSNCKMYGDPANLVNLNLSDLHPRSWYSVAWYPIYRIPDGNFRAAFLTYHSLGHLVHRSAKVDSPSVDACVVSPVLGLQSYNAQGECWFQLRHNPVNQTAGIPSLNPSLILRERLRTLAETASLMARAVVYKGNQTSINRHPDYEFFLSRRGYSHP